MQKVMNVCKAPNPQRLTDFDLPRIGHQIGVGEDEVHAVLEVEARGRGFDSKGRVIMLFEPHVFWRELKPADREEARAKGLAYPKWKRNYPKDSYPRFIEACKIDQNAAFRSCSWGMGQIMGFNCTLAGFDDAESMVKSFSKSEGEQLEGMINFIKSAGLDDELRAHDWRGFARGYNGSGYAKNNYHTRLANAFAKWSKIRDTPWTPEMSEEEDKKAELLPPAKEQEDKPEVVSFWKRVLGRRT